MNFSTTGMMWRPIFLAGIDHLDVFVVLEAIADDRRLVIGDGQHGQQFRLRSGFESEAVGPAVFEDFFDDLALLVDLDRKHAAVIALVAVLLDGVHESAVNLAQPVLQDFAEADQDGRVDAAKHELVDQLFQIDAAVGFFAGMNPEIAVARRRRNSLSPRLARRTVRWHRWWSTDRSARNT